MSARCPICKKPVVAAYAPFCSKRCADVDLQRWFTGGYAIPAAEQGDDDDDLPSSSDE
ncbi:DNA gyrase inhibitor YacG [soil metagenome]